MTVSQTHQRITALETEMSEIKKIATATGGGDNGGVDGRIGKLEGSVQGMDTRLSLVEKDLRTLAVKIDRHLFFTIAGFVSVLGVLAKGFNWL